VEMMRAGRAPRCIIYQFSFSGYQCLRKLDTIMCLQNMLPFLSFTLSVCLSALSLSLSPLSLSHLSLSHAHTHKHTYIYTQRVVSTRVQNALTVLLNGKVQGFEIMMLETCLPKQAGLD
jgi:hypothetical protein